MLRSGRRGYSSMRSVVTSAVRSARPRRRTPHGSTTRRQARRQRLERRRRVRASAPRCSRAEASAPRRAPTRAHCRRTRETSLAAAPQLRCSARNHVNGHVNGHVNDHLTGPNARNRSKRRGSQLDEGMAGRRCSHGWAGAGAPSAFGAFGCSATGPSATLCWERCS
jgi:hypothetical protein